VFVDGEAVEVKQPEPPRPSDALLREAIKQGFIWSGHIKDEREEAWDEWLATIPIDPLKADRETLRRAMDEGTINVISKEVADALDRVAKD
jgi:hypothetical protein